MKLLRGRYLLISIVVIVVTAVFVFVNYRKPESVIINTSVSNTNIEVTQSPPCDIVADTFYLNFHSNMDSAAFYNELRSNPVTRDGVDVGYHKLEVYPTFNDHGCLDYVRLFNRSNESATIGYYAEKLKEELKNDASLVFSHAASGKTEINDSQGVGSDKIAKELMRLYGVPRIYKISEASFEYVYKDKKVMREFSTKYPRKGVKEPEVLSSRIYFYSDRYIQQQDLLEKEELLKMKKRGAQRDSLDATLGSRLK